MNFAVKNQLYNIPGIKDDLQEQEIHPKTESQNKPVNWKFIEIHI